MTFQRISQFDANQTYNQVQYGTSSHTRGAYDSYCGQYPTLSSSQAMTYQPIYYQSQPYLNYQIVYPHGARPAYQQIHPPLQLLHHVSSQQNLSLYPPASECEEDSRTSTTKPPKKSKKIWRCERPGCSSTAEFGRKADLDRHTDTVHEKRKSFACPHRSCDRSIRPFTRKDHLIEHRRAYHGEEIQKRKHTNQYDI
ncbi:hypothetical protein EJ05DRAFT_505052 [Pseudovirgaria hyperparasitica]|uniref:C2H2-type domain-containing protein n=1 Tax=Pseudovirgaria hyperparasitica TaxID=470096 RepID=A0A6A6VS45_9PEZI|nr:uncharacterized protein EJ05DRAFT_505052 [Pseudovirgaria hyperparasitica]KAF2753412.1 hypothetical protein EJ05DRAFT_505052 [Pseudovirgaria hyperparasitica]